MGRRLPQRHCHHASSVFVGGGKALGLSARIAIAALDQACILLDKPSIRCASCLMIGLAFVRILDTATTKMMTASMMTTTTTQRVTRRRWPRRLGTA